MHRIPDWLVNLSRPWNQMYHEAWEAMTPAERRSSFLFDVLIGVLMLLVIWFAKDI